MNEKLIREVISTRFKKIKKHVTQILKGFDPKDIHGFRTEVKKLRAYIRLVTFGLKDSRKYQLPKKFRKVYAAAGAVRDIQLHLDRVHEVALGDGIQPQQYEWLLKKKLRKKKKELKKLLIKLSVNKTEKKVLSGLPAGLKPESIRRFVEHKTDDIRLLSQKKDERDDDIHSIRKNLKDLMYNVKNVQDQNLKKAFPRELSDESKLRSVERLTDELGKFTDMSAAISFTEPAYLDEVQGTEKEQLQQIRELWLKEKSKLREAALNDLQWQEALMQSH